MSRPIRFDDRRSLVIANGLDFCCCLHHARVCAHVRKELPVLETRHRQFRFAHFKRAFDRNDDRRLETTSFFQAACSAEESCAAKKKTRGIFSCLCVVFTPGFFLVFSILLKKTNRWWDGKPAGVSGPRSSIAQRPQHQGRPKGAGRTVVNPAPFDATGRAKSRCERGTASRARRWSCQQQAIGASHRLMTSTRLSCRRSTRALRSRTRVLVAMHAPASRQIRAGLPTWRPLWGGAQLAVNTDPCLNVGISWPATTAVLREQLSITAAANEPASLARLFPVPIRAGGWPHAARSLHGFFCERGLLPSRRPDCHPRQGLMQGA